MGGPLARKSCMPSLDTNVLLRWLIADVPHQAERVDALLKTGERFVIHDAVLIETVFVLERIMLLSRATITEAIRTVLSTANFDVDRSRWSSVMEFYPHSPKLSITDLYLAEWARPTRSAPLYTFDKKLTGQQVRVELL